MPAKRRDISRVTSFAIPAGSDHGQVSMSTFRKLVHALRTSSAPITAEQAATQRK